MLVASTWSSLSTARQTQLPSRAACRRRGLAAAIVREPCRLAAAQYGLSRVRAATSRQRAASQKVLTQAGPFLVGPADPADLGGKPGTWYERVLAVD